ncbi:MAG: heparinase II/III family protein [Verrucomicrobia bacterium]|nr:heparinase II/III family protein [Verrucomicrobiota bacterium]MCG2681799.1 heparinase II/III family protein [Kiritimatiellia bacterium]MBU4247280.1 heparinase II/III family protein [Verrucomicrobiota bacterium]MBU4289896.1 heparinase II/III family protein [Verrucomicrobiota bacterium]MBU4427960.1 heparinase II/III family protein [Verrucomicrobiota bacterium]
MPDDNNRRNEYVRAVTHEAGFLPWQSRDPSRAEIDFRAHVERRKDRLLEQRALVRHPVLIAEEQIERMRKNVACAPWARTAYRKIEQVADHVVRQGPRYIAQMIEELSPTNSMAWNCPHCIGRKSQEGGGQMYNVSWDYRHPDAAACKLCGHTYPSREYPETALLKCPRKGQTFTFYLNDAERAHPRNRSGRYAWRWVGYPVHVSFSGIIRECKIHFMLNALRSLGMVHALTGEMRYARCAIAILNRLAHCYRQWLYKDYWDTFADCDPMYAAWHDGHFQQGMPLEFKRHLAAEAFQGDTVRRARMLQSYWGAGRIRPVGMPDLSAICLAYDLVGTARESDGRPLWRQEERTRFERDLVIECLMECEPFVGGEAAAKNFSNKAPSVYAAMAAGARCLGLPEYADVAIRGYELVRDRQFLFDGFSRESPHYTQMYLGSGLLDIVDVLDGYRWPKRFRRRKGTVRIFQTDAKLKRMMQTYAQQLLPDGRHLPLGDTTVSMGVSPGLAELGARRYPEFFAPALPHVYTRHKPGLYALLNLDAAAGARPKPWQLPEAYYPAWMNAIFRHGQGTKSTVLSLILSPPGNHLHLDNLGLYYFDRGQPILGDLGYVCDTPNTKWINNTCSHNLVIVDDAEQRSGYLRDMGHKATRVPRLHFAAMTPVLSVAEASSKVYDQCSEYSRLVALVKGPGAQTFAIDIFRVKGGKKHAYRIFSELAASDGKRGQIVFTGLDLPKEKPLTDFKASIQPEHIFGLRDVRADGNPPAAWTATWKEKDRAYRLHMASSAHGVEASNGPGMETYAQAGRRVRYVDVIRKGEDVDSIFVAVHEPSGPRGSLPIRRVERLPTLPTAGPDAVALRIESEWGRYLVLSRFAEAADIAGGRFQGDFGVFCEAGKRKRWLVSVGASTFQQDGFGFSGQISHWQGRARSKKSQTLVTATQRPRDFSATPKGCTNHVLVDGAFEYKTGFPIARTGPNSIAVKGFPLGSARWFELPALQYIHP